MSRPVFDCGRDNGRDLSLISPNNLLIGVLINSVGIGADARINCGCSVFDVGGWDDDLCSIIGHLISVLISVGHIDRLFIILGDSLVGRSIDGSGDLWVGSR